MNRECRLTRGWKFQNPSYIRRDEAYICIRYRHFPKLLISSIKYDPPRFGITQVQNKDLGYLKSDSLHQIGGLKMNCYRELSKSGWNRSVYVALIALR